MRSLFLLLVITSSLIAQEAHVSHKGHDLPSPEVIATLPPDGGPKYNRLVFEASPYLQQHATNPVDWYPWGEEALQRAKKENKPIFLSIGYSTCHWCHVMERESFRDDAVAALLNKDFINVKVDREERPDIDKIYMIACQMTSGNCGWPLTAVLTPDLEPFFVGSYFPKEDKYGRPGMLSLMPRIAEAWETRGNELVTAAKQLTESMQDLSKTSMGVMPIATLLDDSFKRMKLSYDKVHGGFGDAPKFPSAHTFTYLLRYAHRTGTTEAKEMAIHSLRKIRKSGLFDHLGYGFHRYSTDRKWLVPHFEKMLYDQGTIALAYLEAYQATGEPEFADVAHEVFTYVLRDMTSPDGAFYSAEDADTEGEEGKFYMWHMDEILGVLGLKDGTLWSKVYNVQPTGNFVEPGNKPNPGHNILHLTQPIEEHARLLGMDQKELERKLEASRKKLFEHRKKRIHPFKDDKILTDWNGLMIAALARGGRVLGEPKYTQAAEKAAAFIEKHLVAENGRLLKRYRNGKAGLPAHLDDYAYTIWGLIELYQTTLNTKYLARAMALCGDAINMFWDGKGGGFFMTAADGETLIARSKTHTDDALPSGNSVMALNLVLLTRLTTNEVFDVTSVQQFRTFSTSLTSYPHSATFMLQALDIHFGPAYEVVLAGDLKSKSMQILRDTLYKTWLPTTVIVHRPEGDAGLIGELAPFVTYYEARDNKATAFVCQHFSCRAPTHDPEQMLRDLGIKKARETQEE